MKTYNRHEIACIIAELFGDDCACKRCEQMTNEETIKYISRAKKGYSDIHFTRAFDKAVEALEKQIPKKPNITSMKLIGGEVLTHYSVCPVCDDVLTIGYPCKCGQMIDWEDDND